jgi:hypothetical protein
MRTSSGVPLIAALGRSTTLGLLNPSSFALNAAIAHVFATESTGMKIYLARSMIGFKKIRISVATWSLKMRGGRRLKQLKQLKKRQIGTSLAGSSPKKGLKLSAKRRRIRERESESERDRRVNENENERDRSIKRGDES